MKWLLLSVALVPAVWGQGLWERRAPLPVEATEVSAAALNGKVYVVCGLTALGSSSNLYIYDPSMDQWSRGASVPIAGGANSCNVAAANGKLYVLGAIRTGSSFLDGNTYEYDSGADAWVTVGRMAIPRGASGVAVLGSKIYVMGGVTPDRPVASVEAFDAGTKLWMSLPDMPTPRDHLTAQAANGRIYAISGRNGNPLPANEEFDPASNTWRTRTPIPSARGGLASGTLRGRIQVFGGEGDSGTADGTFSDNQEYDPASDTWGTVSIITTPRHGFYGVTMGGRIIAPGGAPRSGNTFGATVEAFYLPDPVAPLITATSIGNSANYGGTLAPGMIVTVFGTHLAWSEQTASRFPLVTQMNGVAVTVNGARMPLLYVGPTQVNFHLPYSLVPGPLRIVVSNVNSASADALISDVVPAAPALFSLSSDGKGPGAIRIAATGALAQPARRGDIVSVYCTGLGRVDANIGLGQPAPSERATNTLENPGVSIGGLGADVLFCGLTPGTVGLYQLNVRVPDGVALGAAVPVVVQIADKVSNMVTIGVAP